MRMLLVATLMLFIFLGAINFRNAGAPTSLVTGTYANSQIDTVKYKREGAESALYFWMHLRDSSKVTSIFVRQVNDTVVMALAAGDTLLGTADSSTTARIIAATVPVTPLAQELWFIVTYAATKNGVTTPGVTYGLNKQYR